LTVFAGVRPLSFLGFELVYSDFGSVSAGPPTGDIFGDFDAHSRQNAAMLFGIGHVPLPVPYLDLYG
jgi:hypothetical protein